MPDTMHELGIYKDTWRSELRRCRYHGWCANVLSLLVFAEIGVIVEWWELQLYVDRSVCFPMRTPASACGGVWSVVMGY